MPPTTAWRRRRSESTPQRGASPVRPTADSIERLSPDPHPQTPPPATQHAASHARRDVNGHTLQGLGLANTSLGLDPDHLYLDSDGRAHLGAKRKTSKHPSASSRAPAARQATTQYRGPPKRSHARVSSAMSIDDLANIAIATSPQFASANTFSFDGSPVFHAVSRPNTSYINGYSQEAFDRPAKRIRSERVYPSEWSHQDDRPRSSDDHAPEIRQEDAELLLSLQNGFSFKHLLTPEPAASKLDPIPEASPQHKLAAPFELVPESTDPRASSDEPAVLPDPSRDRVKHEPSTPHRSHAGSKQVYQSPRPARQPSWEQADPSNTDVNDEDEKYVPSIQAATGTVEEEAVHQPDPTPALGRKPTRVPIETNQPACPICHQINSNAREGEATIAWIKCEGSCDRWFHQGCAGFTDQAVKRVAKFICKQCEPDHGETTYTRTSARARAAPNYAALNEGVTVSNEDDTMHHFVPRLKDGSLSYQTDNFARIRPELMTQELWENFDGIKRPFVVPANWNPRFGRIAAAIPSASSPSEEERTLVTISDGGEEIKESKEFEEAAVPFPSARDQVVDLDQDYLDMVMPRDLTVPKVAQLYGPHEPVPVIDVKSQETKGKFTLEQWARYYEDRSIKEIKNVISLEVSHSPLGRLIRRPKVVRDIDLEDQVWDLESRNASTKRPVAFYCLMSVGDSYTDFHIDFGGSSVYYHILKGRKTFFFIPPEDKYLKKYEEWNNTANQKSIWLGDWCDNNVTRVDLYPGDTAFIPSGWIHSVWTPEDSLVIGGNFLTRYDLRMQLKVTEIEKTNGVPQKFRYPFFQKVMWYTLIKYLEEDPVPDAVINDFEEDPDCRFLRAVPVWQDSIRSFEFEPEEGDFNARTYSKSELSGLPDLRDYLYRTARIQAELPVVPSVSKEAANKVKASIPKGHGDPLQLIHLFAVWIAWKRGNEKAPDWLHTDDTSHEHKDKEKVSRRSERFHIPGERQSARRRTQAPTSPGPGRQDTPETDDASPVKQESKVPARKIACAACRKKGQLCRHSKLEESAKETLEKDRRYSNVTIDIAKLARASPVVNSIEGPTAQPQPAPQIAPPANVTTSTSDESAIDMSTDTTDLAQAALARMTSHPPEAAISTMNGAIATPNSAKKGRSKACDECRKSKRRCVHDEHGRVDPAKAAEPSKPRGSSTAKRPPRLSDEHQAKRLKTEDDFAVYAHQHELDAMIDPALMAPAAPTMNVPYRDLSMPVSDVNAFSTPPHAVSTQSSFATAVTQPPRHNVEPQIDPALMDPALSLPSPHQNGSTDDARRPAPLSALPALSTATASTPDVDKSYSPLTGDGVTPKNDSDTEQKSGIQPRTDDNVVPPPHTNGTSYPRPYAMGNANEETFNGDKAATRPEQPTSPKQEVKSPPSHAVVTSSVQEHQSPTGGAVQDKSSPQAGKQESVSPTVKIEKRTATPGRDIQRANTVGSNVSSPEGDASERLARELQAQEHGLRRRPSVRIS